MNQKVIKKVKHMMRQVMLVILIVGNTNIWVIQPLWATETNQIAKENQEITIKGTTLKLTGITDTSESDYKAITFDLSRDEGIPQEANKVRIYGTGKFTLGGKQYVLLLQSGEGNIKKLSEAKATSTYSYIACREADGKVPAHLKASQMKGITIDFTIDKVVYINYCDQLGSQLREYLKTLSTAEGVPFKKANLYVPQDKSNAISAKIREEEKKNRPKNVLPEKGLKLSLREATNIVPSINPKEQNMIEANKKQMVDNIGFVDGKLHMRIKVSKDSGLPWISLIDSSGKEIMYKYYLSDPKNYIVYYVFDIKDLNALSQYKMSLNDSVSVLEDKETKSISWRL